MADNSTASLGTQDGDTFRTLEDANDIKWPAGVGAYATTVSSGANVLQVVTPSNPYPVTIRDAEGNDRALNVDANGAIAVTDGGGSFTVDGTVTANLGAVDNAVLDAIVTLLSGTLTVDGSGVTQPVSGTVTANLSATDNAVLDAIQAATEAVQTAVEGTLTVGSHAVTNAGTFAVQAAQSGNWNITNISGTVSLPTGAATAAKQPALGTAGTASADVITIQGVASMTPVLVDGSATTQPVSGTVTANLSATDNAVLDSIQTATEAAQAALEGTLSVAAHAVTNAGTFAVQVDGDALTSLQLIDNIVRLEDSAHSTGDAGVMMLAVRQDSQSNFGADGDYVPLSIDDSGRLRVVSSGGASGGTSETDDAAFTAGSGSGTPAMGFFSSDTVDSGDVGVLAMDASRRLLVSVEADNAGLATETTVDAIKTAVEGTLTVGSHAVTNAGTFAVQVDGTALTRLTDIETNTNFGAVTGGGTETGALRVTIANNSTGVLSIDDNGGSITVDASSLPLPTGAATAANQSTANAALSAIQTAVQTLDNIVSGSEAQVDIVAPLPAGTNAIGKLAANSGVDIGDVDVTSISAGTNRIGGTYDVGGSIIDEGGNVLTVKRAKIGAASSGENTLVAAVASKQIRVLSMMLVAGGDVEIYFNNATTGAIFGDSTNKIDLTANSGFTLPHNEHGWFQTGTVNEALRVNLDGAVKVSGGLTYVEV